MEIVAVLSCPGLALNFFVMSYFTWVVNDLYENRHSVN